MWSSRTLAISCALAAASMSWPGVSAPAAAASARKLLYVTIADDHSPQDAAAAQFCPDIHFEAYSTVEPGGQRLVESMDWDSQQRAYLIRGPQLGRVLDYPGVTQTPTGTPDPQQSFKIAISAHPTVSLSRFCQENFQESAECTITTTGREILYTQLYTDCNLQTYKHLVRISQDQIGKLTLLVLSLADVRGEFEPPIYFAARSDLRFGGCSLRGCGP